MDKLSIIERCRQFRVSRDAKMLCKESLLLQTKLYFEFFYCRDDVWQEYCPREYNATNARDALSWRSFWTSVTLFTASLFLHKKECFLDFLKKYLPNIDCIIYAAPHQHFGNDLFVELLEIYHNRLVCLIIDAYVYTRNVPKIKMEKLRYLYLRVIDSGFFEEIISSANNLQLLSLTILDPPLDTVVNKIPFGVKYLSVLYRDRYSDNILKSPAMKSVEDFDITTDDHAVFDFGSFGRRSNFPNIRIFTLRENYGLKVRNLMLELK